MPEKNAGGAGFLEGIHIAHLIETNGPGGAEQVLAVLVRALQRAGSRNTVFLPADGERWLNAQLEGSGADLVPFRLEIGRRARFAFWLANRLRALRVRLAHSHEFTMAVYGACAARTANVPHVITMHGSRYYAGHSRRYAAMRVAAALSGRMIAVSQPLRRALIEDLRLSAACVDVIMNGAPIPDLSHATLRRELDLRPDDELAVSVGNLYPVKGHRFLVDALALLKEDHPNLHLALAGRGELREPLERRARELGVAERVHLLGLRDDVPNVLASADLFVLPSLSEGLPMALLEAMLAGVPVVATSVGEVQEVLARGRFGATVLPGDAAELAAAIRRILCDAQGAAATAERACARARERFSVDRMVDAYVSVYEEVLEKRTAPTRQTSRVGAGPRSSRGAGNQASRVPVGAP